MSMAKKRLARSKAQRARERERKAVEQKQAAEAQAEEHLKAAELANERLDEVGETIERIGKAVDVEETQSVHASDEQPEEAGCQNKGSNKLPNVAESFLRKSRIRPRASANDQQIHVLVVTMPRSPAQWATE